MSRNARVTSVVVEGDPEWYLGWALEESVTPPADSDSALLSSVGSPHFAVTGSKDGFYSVWFGRVPEWEIRSTDGPAGPTDLGIPRLTIEPGPDAQITSFSLGISGATGWTVFGPEDPPVVVGGRSSYIKREQALPIDSSSPSSTEDFQYSITRSYSYDAAVPADSVHVALEFELKVLWSSTINYGGIAYVPYSIRYTWTYTEVDGGSSTGGFITEYAFITNGDQSLGTNTMSVIFRVGQRQYDGSDHFAPKVFSATELKSIGVFASGETSTTADTTSLEVDGGMLEASIWIQPQISDETYFGWRADNLDDSTALVDIDTGHHLVPDISFPLTLQPTDD